MKKFGGDKKYIYWGVTAFVVIACCILLYMVVQHWGSFAAGLASFGRIISPFIWGVVIAYLLRPVTGFIQRTALDTLGDRLFPRNERRSFVFSRGISIFLSEAFMVVVVAALLRLVLPQLYTSVESIVLGAPDYFDKAAKWGEKVLNDYPRMEQIFVNLVGETGETLVEWIKTSLMPRMTDLIANITNWVYYFVRGIYYVVVGIIVSVYILFNKEAVSTGAKKVTYSLFKPERALKILDGVRFTDRIFMGFVSGKILDSAIIGVICYICCMIMGMPYATLVSVIVGVTNVIPFFGPFIGAIPAALIILMMSPFKCLIFLIFIFLLQQFDGNILGPKILGESTGINGFWVMFSIIIGAGLFGFVGMLLGVPVFVILYTGAKNLINRKLEKSGLPTETAQYEDLDHFDPETGEPIALPPKPTPRERREEKAAQRQKTRAALSEKAIRLKRKTEKSEKKDDDAQR